jgi:fructose-specific phosphotransferase system IIA component
MKICDILSVNQIKAEVTESEKDKVIEELVGLLKDEESINNIEVIKNAVLEREKIMSTGVGKGFAIPHAKTSAVKGIVASFGRCKNPIDFNALDGQPVNLVFVLIGQDNMVGPHIKLLSRISRMMNKDEFRDALANAKDADEIYSIFDEEEKKYFELT